MTQASGTGNVTLQAAALAGGAASTPTGALTGSASANLTAANLTTVGTVDWAKWPGYIHKAAGGSLIPTFTMIGPASVQTYDNDQRPISWSDGTPTPTASNDLSGAYTSGTGNGFQLNAPADTTTRNILVYVGGWMSGGKLVAHLSDGSAPDYVDTSFASSTGQ